MSWLCALIAGAIAFPVGVTAKTIPGVFGSPDHASALVDIASRRMSATDRDALHQYLQDNPMRASMTQDEATPLQKCHAALKERPLTENDFRLVREAMRHYVKRAGPIHRFHYFLSDCRDSLLLGYQEERCRCLIASSKSLRPVQSRRLEAFSRDLQRIGMLTDDEIRGDLRLLEATSKGRMVVDETRHIRYPPAPLEEVRLEQQRIQLARENLRRLGGVLSEFVAPSP